MTEVEAYRTVRKALEKVTEALYKIDEAYSALDAKHQVALEAFHELERRTLTDDYLEALSHKTDPVWLAAQKRQVALKDAVDKVAALRLELREYGDLKAETDAAHHAAGDALRTAQDDLETMKLQARKAVAEEETTT